MSVVRPIQSPSVGMNDRQRLVRPDRATWAAADPDDLRPVAVDQQILADRRRRHERGRGQEVARTVDADDDALGPLSVRLS